MRIDPKVYEQLTGQSWETGQAFPWVEPVKAVGNQWAQAVQKAARAFVAQIPVVSNQAGLPDEYLPYLSWVIFEGQRERLWPSKLSKDRRKALILGADLASATGFAPNHLRGFQVPEGINQEVAVNEAVGKLGRWALANFPKLLMQPYLEAIKDQAPTLVTALGISPQRAGNTLRVLFNQALREHPSWWPEGSSMREAVSALF